MRYQNVTFMNKQTEEYHSLLKLLHLTYKRGHCTLHNTCTKLVYFMITLLNVTLTLFSGYKKEGKQEKRSYHYILLLKISHQIYFSSTQQQWIENITRP